MLDAVASSSRSETTSGLKTFRLQHNNMTQEKLATLFGYSQQWVAARETGVNPEEVWIRSHLDSLELELRRQNLNSTPPCPECGVQMKPRNWYLQHWKYGKFKEAAFCKGSPGRPHGRVPMGMLPNGQWQRLDRIVNERTGQETPLRNRKVITKYEREFDFVWCDSTSGRSSGCGGLLTPAGKYRFHKGSEYHIFRCHNSDCDFGHEKGGDRLYCRGGRCYEAGAIPSSSRKSSLPEDVHCFYCKGPVHSRGRRNAPPHCIQLHCVTASCGKISYWDEVVKRVLPGRRAGGNFPADPHRPRCKKCGKKRRVHRVRYTKAQLLVRPTFISVPVRIKMKVRAALRRFFERAKPRDFVLHVYRCAHQETYKTPRGEHIWKRKAGEHLPRGRSFNYSIAHRHGRPVTR